MNDVPGNGAATISSQRRVLVATLLGNFTEWFDFAVYGAVATIVATVFFPSDNPTASLLASLGAFGVAFLFRPIGGLILGPIGDRYGRRVALSAAVVGMAVATTLIALLPSYETAGILAPVLLVLLRAVQGLSAGGEWTTASAFLVEYAPQGRRGRSAALISSSAAVAIGSGYGIVLVLQSIIGPAAMADWGWRVPFLLAAPLGLVGLYLRLRLHESPVYQELQARRKVAASPLRGALRGSWATILLAFACASATGVGFYYFATYFVTYLTTTGGMARTPALLVIMLALLIYAALCPLTGALSDRIGRRPVYIGGCVGHLVLCVPAFLLLGNGWFLTLLGLLIFGAVQTGLNVMSSVVIVELFPPETRSTGAALGYSLGVGPIAGVGPLVAAALGAASSIPFAPMLFLLGVCVVVPLILVPFLPETAPGKAPVASSPVPSTKEVSP